MAYDDPGLQDGLCDFVFILRFRNEGVVEVGAADARDKFGSAGLRGITVVLVFTMAVTGGYVSSAIMAAAPPLVGNAPARRASAGSFMTLALIAGLTGGALLGVVLDAVANGMRADATDKIAPMICPTAFPTAAVPG